MKKAYKNQDYSNIAHLLSVITGEDETQFLRDLSRFGLRHFFANIDSLGYSSATEGKLRNIDELAQNLRLEDL